MNPPENASCFVHVIRAERGMLDSNLANLHGVTTGALKQAVPIAKNDGIRRFLRAMPHYLGVQTNANREISLLFRQHRVDGKSAVSDFKTQVADFAGEVLGN